MRKVELYENNQNSGEKRNARITLALEVAVLNPADASIFSAPITLRDYLNTTEPARRIWRNFTFSEAQRHFWSSLARGKRSKKIL